MEDTQEYIFTAIGNNLLNLYLVGSRLYGAQHEKSDFDFLAVVDQVPAHLRNENDNSGISSAFFVNVRNPDKHIDVGVYQLDYWEHLLNEEQEIFCIICQYIKPHNIFKHSSPIQYFPRFQKLKQSVCHTATKNIDLAKRFFKDGNLYRCLKKIVFVFRILDFAIQVIESGTIVNWGKYNCLAEFINSYFDNRAPTVTDELANIGLDLKLDFRVFKTFKECEYWFKPALDGLITTLYRTLDNQVETLLGSLTSDQPLVIQWIHKYGLDSLTKYLSVRTYQLDTQSLISLHYTQGESPIQFRMVQECSGMIVAMASDTQNNNNTMNTNGQLQIVTYPFIKFFDYDINSQKESQVNSKNPRPFIEQPPLLYNQHITVYPKYDGILSMLFWFNGNWRVSIGSSFETPQFPQTSNSSVNEGTVPRLVNMFWKIWTDSGYFFPDPNWNISYVFELCSLKCRKIVVYEEDQLVLIGSRSLDTMQEIPHEEIAQKNHWKYAKNIQLDSTTSVLDDVIKMASTLSVLDQEGFVICDQNFSRVSVKSPEYQLIQKIHNMIPSMIQPRHFVPFLVNDLKRDSQSREQFSEYFPQYATYYQTAQKIFDQMVDLINSKMAQLRSVQDPKEFASVVKKTKFVTGSFNKGVQNIMFLIRKNSYGSFQDLLKSDTEVEVERWYTEFSIKYQ